MTLRHTGLFAFLIVCAFAMITAGRAAEPGQYVSVTDAWARAELHHPRVLEARERFVSLERDLTQREAAYSPTLSISASGLSLRVTPDGDLDWSTPGASFNAGLKLPIGASVSGSAQTGGSGGDEWRGNVSLSYPLFRSASLDGDALALRQAHAALETAFHEYTQLLDEVRAEVLSALHGEQVAARRVVLALEGYDEAMAAYGAIQERVELGIEPEAELITARIDRLRAEQERTNALRTWESRRRQLADLLGLDDDIEAYGFENVLEWPVPPPGEVTSDDVARAIAHSAAVRERRQAEETARLQWEAERERAGVDARLSGGFRTTGSEGSQRPGWHVGIELSYPLMDQGQRRMGLESRAEAYERAQRARHDAEHAVGQQVEEARFQLDDAARDVEIAELELLQAQLQLEAVARQATLIVPTESEQRVRQYERAVVRAELARSEALQRYRGRWIELQQMLGPVDWAELIGSAGEESH